MKQASPLLDWSSREKTREEIDKIADTFTNNMLYKLNDVIGMWVSVSRILTVIANMT